MRFSGKGLRHLPPTVTHIADAGSGITQATFTQGTFMQVLYEPTTRRRLLLSTLSALMCSQFFLAAQAVGTGLAEADVYRKYGYVRLKDGVRLAYVVWRPKIDGRYPVLLQYSGYDDDAMTFEGAKRYLEAGYAVIGANIRGSGCSEGASFLPFSPNEGPDGAQIVEWAGVQPWSTGNVGMVGVSYEADVQWLVGAERPPHLKALSGSGSSASDYRDWLMVGGMFHQGAIGEWGLIGQESAGRSGAQRRIREWGDTECELILARRKPNNWYYLVRRHPLQDDWWERTGLSKEHVAPLITVPTMLMAGLQDEYTNPATAGRGFAHLLPMVVHKKLIYTNGGHGAAYLEPVFKESIRWMDHWLKGVENGIDKEPPITIFWETRIPGIDLGHDEWSTEWRDELGRAVPGWTTTYASWPITDLQWSTFYLTADAKLSRTEPSGGPAQGIRNYLYPIGTELVGSDKQFAVIPEPAGSLNYRTEPVGEDMVVLGNPEIDIYFSSDENDTDFMVTLKDIDPQGNTLYLTRGFLRASLRAIDPRRTWPDEINQSYRRVQKLIPGKVYEARWSLWTMGHVVRRGHCLELSILAPTAIPSPQLGAAPIGAPSVNAVYHSSTFPSKLLLPVVPGEKAQAQAPQCGRLWNQPCRKSRASVEDWRGGFIRDELNVQPR